MPATPPAAAAPATTAPSPSAGPAVGRGAARPTGAAFRERLANTVARQPGISGASKAASEAEASTGTALEPGAPAGNRNAGTGAAADPAPPGLATAAKSAPLAPSPPEQIQRPPATPGTVPASGASERQPAPDTRRSAPAAQGAPADQSTAAAMAAPSVLPAAIAPTSAMPAGTAAARGSAEPEPAGDAVARDSRRGGQAHELSSANGGETPAGAGTGAAPAHTADPLAAAAIPQPASAAPVPGDLAMPPSVAAAASVHQPAAAPVGGSHAGASQSAGKGPEPAAPAHQVAAPLVAFASGANGNQRLTVRLDPEALGTVQVRIDRPKDGPARVEVTAERPETLALLQRDQPQLQRALDQAGVPPDGRTLVFQAAPQPHLASANPLPDPGQGSGGGQSQAGGGRDGNGGASSGNGRPGDLGGDEQAAWVAQAARRMARPGLDITA